VPESQTAHGSCRAWQNGGRSDISPGRQTTLTLPPLSSSRQQGSAPATKQRGQVASRHQNSRSQRRARQVTEPTEPIPRDTTVASQYTGRTESDNDFATVITNECESPQHGLTNTNYEHDITNHHYEATTTNASINNLQQFPSTRTPTRRPIRLSKRRPEICAPFLFRGMIRFLSPRMMILGIVQKDLQLIPPVTLFFSAYYLRPPLGP
jgi:hypothetical protein